MSKKSSKIDTIGSVEIVDFPELDILSVPAKIDTGADSSSIWATDISIDRDELHFRLFGQGNQFYSNEKISTKEFQSISVKNSFGGTETRYKVRILVSIGKRKIRSWFTLSDRSAMAYPVLIGRNFLRQKFIVDVSKIKVHSNQKSRTVLVLVSNPQEELTEFLGEVKSLVKISNLKFVVRSYNELAFIIDRNKVKVFETITNKDLGKFDLVYFKSHKNSQILATSAAQYLRYCNVKFFDRELIANVAYDKLSENIHLALFRLPIPITICGSIAYLKENANKIVDRTGWPVVCKEIHEDRGRKNFLVHSKKELDEVLGSAAKSDIFMLQAYVPNNGYMRAYVFGSEISLAIFRSTYEHKNKQKSHLNNPSGSVNANMIKAGELKPAVKDLAVRAAKLMNRQISGVDLIQNKNTGKWYILEVNKGPQLRSGSFIKEKKQSLAKFIEHELNR